MIIAQVTDTHIRIPGKLAYRRVDTAKYLAEAVAHLNGLAPLPDVVVMTGDLVDFAKPEEYAHLAALIAPFRAPVYLLPGNHDGRDEMRQAFPAHRYLPREGFLQYTIEDWPVRLVAVDTLIPGEGGGEVCAARLVWLEKTLAAEPRRPTVVMMHHPPFRTGIGFMDGHGLKNREGYAAVSARHPQVERVIARWPELGAQVSRNRRNVFDAFPQRRYLNDDHREAVVQVFPKRAGINFFLEVLVGCHNEPCLYPFHTGPPDPADFVLLQDPQELGLQG